MRTLYGLTPADTTVNRQGAILPNVPVRVFTARQGGSPVTDLLNLDGSPISEVTSDAEGVIGFFGPDGYDGELWVTAGGQRLMVRPVTLAGLPDGSQPQDVLVWDGTAWVPQDGSHIAAAALTAAEGADAKATQAQESADLKLPLAGGTMTGEVRFGQGITAYPSDDSSVVIVGDSVRPEVTESVVLGWGPINPADTLSSSVSLKSGLQVWRSTDKLNTTDTFSGPFDPAYPYWVRGTSNVVIDGQDTGTKSYFFVPTKTDHAVTATGLNVQRRGYRLARTNVVEIGASDADQGAVAIGGAAAYALRAIAVGGGAKVTAQDGIGMGRNVVVDNAAIVKFGTPGVASRLQIGSVEFVPLPALKAAAASSADFAAFQAAIAAL